VSVTTTEDVEAALVRQLTDAELGVVYRVLDLVEAEVLVHLPGYDLEPVSSETVTVTARHGETLYLPRYPVTAVLAVSVNGVALAASLWSVSAKGVLTLSADVPSANGPEWGWGWGSTVTVTYSHGQPAAGSPLVLLIAEAVASHLRAAASDGLRSMTLGDYSESYGPQSSSGGLVDRKRLAPYRRSAVGSIVLTGA